MKTRSNPYVYLQSILLIVGFYFLLFSCSKDNDPIDEFSIVGMWTQSIEDKSYNESEHFTFKFNSDKTGVSTVDGNWGEYLTHGPFSENFTYKLDNEKKILIITYPGFEDDPWSGSILIYDNNKIEWDGMILHRM